MFTNLAHLIPEQGILLKLSRGEGDSLNLAVQQEAERFPVELTSLPPIAHDASDIDHLIYSSMRLCELRVLGVEAMSPNDPAIRLSGGDASAAHDEAVTLVTNHIEFHRKRIEAAIALSGGGFSGRKTRAPKVKPVVDAAAVNAAADAADKATDAAQPELGEIVTCGTAPSEAAAEAKVVLNRIAADAEAAKQAKTDDAKAKQAELAAQVQRAEELGFKW